jgi:hypothetical protein
VEAVVQSGAGTFAGGGGAWLAAAATIPMDGEGDGGGELHAATEGKRENTCRGGYQRSSEERR